MANHGFSDPSANYTYDGAVEPGVFRLQAMRNISAGEEVRKDTGFEPGVLFGCVGEVGYDVVSRLF